LSLLALTDHDIDYLREMKIGDKEGHA